MKKRKNNGLVVAANSIRGSIITVIKIPEKEAKENEKKKYLKK